MQQIRLGLQDNLTVEKYADPSFDWFQMEQIRTGLKDVNRKQRSATCLLS